MPNKVSSRLFITSASSTFARPRMAAVSLAMSSHVRETFKVSINHEWSAWPYRLIFQRQRATSCASAGATLVNRYGSRVRRYV